MLRSRLAPYLLISALALSSQQSGAEPVELNNKLEKYHTILLKRPSSSNLFQTFQTHWLTEKDEASLTAFLKQRAATGTSADLQIYGYLLLQRGLDNEALEAFSQSLEIDPENGQAWFERSRCYAKLLDFDRAIEDVEKAIELTENEELKLKSNKLKGRFLIRSGNTDKAITHWNKLAAENQDDTDLIEDVIDIQLADGLNEAALKLATALREKTKDPYKKAIITLRIADILQKTGQRKKAIDTYLESLSSSGSNSWLEREIIAQLQQVYKKEDDQIGLTETLKSLSEKYPQRTHIHRKYAEALATQQDFEQAGEIYKDLLKKKPQDKPLRVAYLNLLNQSGNFKEAGKLIDFLIEQNPKDAQLHLQKAAISDKVEDRESLLKSLNAYRDTVEGNPSTTLKYAQFLSKYRFTAQAIEAYKNAVVLYPDSLELAFSTAAFLNRNKQADEALKLWKSISTKANEVALIRLLETLQSSNQAELAYEMAVQFHPKHQSSPAYLRSACSIAEQNKQLEQAIVWSRDLIHLSEKSNELDAALSLTTRLITKAQSQEKILNELSSKQNLSIAETCLMAEIKDATGDVTAADAILKELIESKDPLGLLQASRIYERRHDTNLAANALEILTELPQGKKNVYLRRLSSLYEQAGMPEKALATVERWKLISPNDKLAWLTQARLIEEGDSSEAALLKFRRGIDRFSDDVEVISRLAELYTAANRNSQAMQIYWRLYDDAEDLSDRIRWAAQLCDTANYTGESEKLVDDFKSRCRRNPTSITPLMALAEVHRRLGQYEERRNLLLEATRIRPNDAKILIEIAAIDEREGNSIRAIEILERAQSKDKSGVAVRRLAKLYIDEGDFERGLEKLTEAVNTGSKARDVEAIILPLLKQSAFEEAKAYLEIRLSDHSDDWRLLILSSVIDYELGFSESSFDTALKILNSEKDLGSPAGWELDDFSKMYSMIGVDKLPTKVQQMLIAPIVKTQLQQLTQSSQNSHRSFMSFGGTAGASRELPAQLEGAKLVATIQITKLLGEVDLEQAKAWITQSGIQSMELWQAILSQSGQANIYQNQESSYLLDYIENHPEEKEALMLLLVQNFLTGDLTLPGEIAKTARKLFSNETNIPMFEIILTCLKGENEDPKKHLDAVISNLEKKPKLEDNDLLILVLLNREALEGSQQGGSAAAVDEKVVAQFKRYIQANPLSGNAPNINSLSNPTKNTFTYQLSIMANEVVVNALISGQDYPALITAIEKDEVSTMRSMYSGMQFWGRQGQEGFPTLSFPPKPLTHVSAAQASLFDAEGSMINAAELKPHLELFKNPLLKVLAANFCGEVELVATLIKELSADSKQSANSAFLEAAWLSTHSGDPADILNLLEKARMVTIDKAQRQEIDKYLVGVAMNLTPQQRTAAKDSLQHSRASARRMLISRKITEVEEIESILTNLEMTAERGRYLTKSNQAIRKQKPVAGGLIGSHNIRSNSSSSSRQQLSGKVEGQMEKNKPEAAARLVVLDLRNKLKSNNASSYELEKISKLVIKHNLAAQVSKAMHPGNSSSPRRWLAFYETAKLLKDVKGKEEAINFLSNLSSPPSSVRLPLALALFESDQERAMKLLLGVRQRDQLFSSLYQKINQVHSSSPKYVPLLELTADYLEKSDLASKPLNQNEVEKFKELFNKCVNLQSWNRPKLEKYWETPLEVTKNKELTERRDKALAPMALN